jgi:hypothetical protein
VTLLFGQYCPCRKKWAGLVDYEYLLTMFSLSSTKKGWVFMAKTLYKSTNQWENGIAGF